MKFKQRFSLWNKQFLNEYDIRRMLGSDRFTHKDFEIIFPSEVILRNKHGTLVWKNDFASAEILAEFLFYWYKRNFYPQPGGFFSRNKETNWNFFENLKRQIEAVSE